MGIRAKQPLQDLPVIVKLSWHLAILASRFSKVVRAASRFDRRAVPVLDLVGSGAQLLLGYFKRFSWPNPACAHYDSTLNTPAVKLDLIFELKRYEPTSAASQNSELSSQARTNNSKNARESS